MLDCPILFIVFNRPEETARVFERIRQARPVRLYITADGPRAHKEDELALSNKVRSIVEQVDWPCAVKTFYRNENVGCGKAVSSGITWFFEHEESGIILEDDCLPELSFFPFCAELLERYKEDKRVYQINGVNFMRGHTMPNSYTFSIHQSVWGWATWRNRWNSFTPNWQQIDIDAFANKVLPDLNIQNKYCSDYLIHEFSTAKKKNLNVWGFPWVINVYSHHGLCIVPEVNLVSNIGFGQTATHTLDGSSVLANFKSEPVNFPLRHPAKVERDLSFDLVVENSYEPVKKPAAPKPTFIARVKNKLRSYLSRL